MGAHTTSLGAGGARASLGGRAARGSGARAGGASGRGSVNGEVVGAEAGLLAVGVLLGVGSSASTLRAGGDTAVGVVDLGLVGAGNLVALGDTADVLSGTCRSKELAGEEGMGNLLWFFAYSSLRTGPQQSRWW